VLAPHLVAPTPLKDAASQERGKQVPGTGAARSSKLLNALLFICSKHLIEAKLIMQSVLLHAEYLYIVVNGEVCSNV